MKASNIRLGIICGLILSFSIGCKRRSNSSQVRSNEGQESLLDIMGKFPMKLWTHIPNEMGRKNAVALINGLSSSLTYALWTNKFRNGYGNKSMLPDKPKTEGAVSQALRMLSSYDLYMTSVLKRLKYNKGLPSNVTFVYAPIEKSEQANNEVFSTPLKVLYLALNPFQNLKLGQIPSGAFDDSQISSHGFLKYRDGEFKDSIRDQFIKRYDAINKIWNDKTSEEEGFVALSKRFSPLLINTNIVNQNNKVMLYTEFVFMAPGLPDIFDSNTNEIKDLKDWKIENVQMKLPVKNIIWTPFAYFNYVNYMSQNEAEKKYPIFKVAIKKVIADGNWKESDHQADANVSFSNLSEKTQSEYQGELLNINHDKDDYAVQVKGKIFVQPLSGDEWWKETANNAIKKANEALKNFNLSLNFMNAEVNLFRKVKSLDDIRDAFEKDYPFTLDMKPNVEQRLEIVISWKRGDIIENKIAQVFADELVDALKWEHNGITIVKGDCPEGNNVTCSLKFPVLGKDDEKTLIGLLKNYFDGFVRSQLQTSAQYEGRRTTFQLDTQINNFVSGALNMIESQRQYFSDRVSQIERSQFDSKNF